MTARKPKAVQTPESVAEAALTGDRLQSLRALRDRLARDIDGCDSKRDMAALSLRFMDVVEQIADLEGPVKAKAAKETGLSEFEKRLRQRESASKTPRRSSG